MVPEQTPLQARWCLYLLFGLIGLASLSARIANVQSNDRRTPFLSANDRSRWCQIYALVHQGKFEIDLPMTFPGWDSIDKVRHRDRQGEMHFYSSKPPLFPTLVAAKYWLLRTVTGASLSRQPFFTARILLVTTNVIPLAIYLLVMYTLIEAWGTTSAGKIFTAAAATFGTFILTFGITLNNHLPATIGLAVSLWALYQIISRGSRNPLWFALAGLAGAWTAANELPALAFVTLLGALCLWLAPRPTLLGFIPGALIVAAPFFALNYAAHQSLKPAYTHRSPTENWYDYPGSYWADGVRKGIDRGEPSRIVYAANSLIGHHGIFSLTPLWILSVWGLRLSQRHADPTMRWLTGMTIALTLICWLFYMSRPLIDRNYGGVSCGFRWMFWFTPLWLVALLPAADRCLQSHRGRWIAAICLAVSVFSAHFAAMNPWSHPWIYRYWESLGWIS